MELLDRYLKFVKLFLPRAQQDDIIRELSEDIHSQVEDKEAELGRSLNRAEQEQMIGQLGHPALLAGRYGPRRHLIGPELFPFYWLVLKLALGANALAHLIAMSVALASGHLVNPVYRTLSAIAALFVSFGIVTIVFALLDLYRPRGVFSRRWHSGHLNAVPAVRPHEPSPITRAVSGTIFLLWWITARQSPALILGGGAEVFKLGPVWESAYSWIVVVSLVGIANACLELAAPRWVRLRLAMRVIATFGGVGVLLFLLSAGHFVVLVDPVGQPGRLDSALRVINQSVYWGLSIALLIVIVKSFIGLRSWSRSQGRPRPQDGARVLAVIVGAVLLASALVINGV